MDLELFSVEMAEILIKVLPNDDEVKKFQGYLKDKKDPKLLPPDDKFLFDVRELQLSDRYKLIYFLLFLVVQY